MRLIFVALITLATLYGCSTVKIIDINPDSPADILKSEMSGLSPSQTNTQGSWQSTLEYVNNKLNYGEKVFYSTSFKKFVHAKFSNEYKLFEISELDIENAIIRRQGAGSKRPNTNLGISIPAKDQTNGFEHIFASGKRSTSPYIIFKVDSASDSIKIKQAFELMSRSENSSDKQE